MSHPVISAEGLSGVELKKSTTLSNQAHGAMSLGGMRHILALDGVRGLAVFMVLAQHCFFAAPESPWRVLGEMAQTGWVGVDLFFCSVRLFDHWNPASNQRASVLLQELYRTASIANFSAVLHDAFRVPGAAADCF
ncbi:hypothetical protein AYO47_08810 [Planctomyces sp. SCGC AG-212-M04]|nr:hypothetical protein AYO47_08810 [Planctomyces sp. SCGC AG-212-M04]